MKGTIQYAKNLWQTSRTLQTIVQTALGFWAAFLMAGGQLAGRFLPFSVCLAAAMPLGAVSIAASVGGCLGYLSFWGIDTALEPICVIMLSLTAQGIFHNTTALDSEWFMPAICAATTAMIGAVFLFDAQISWVSVGLLFGRVVFAFGATMADRAALRRNYGAMLLVLGTTICGLVGVQIGQMFNFGIFAATTAAFWFAQTKDAIAIAAVCGVAVDMTGLCLFPMSAVLCLGSLASQWLNGRMRVLFSGAAGMIGAFFLALMPDAALISIAFGTAIGLTLPPVPLAKKLSADNCAMQDRLQRMAQVLDQLEQTALEAALPSVGVTSEILYDHAAERICRSCAYFHNCWEELADETCRNLYRAAPDIFAKSKAEPSDFPEAFTARCHHLEGFTMAVNQELDGLLYRRQYRVRTQEQQKLLSMQFGCLSRLLRDTAAEVDWRVSDLPKYRIEVGSASIGKQSHTVCGDQWACFTTEPTVCYVLLGDGMGTGEEAEKQSKDAICLLSDLIRSGCEVVDALQMLNGLYILRGDGAFSAMDVLRIDLCSADVTLYKWGGAASYLKKGQSVKKLGIPSPPPGVGIGSEPQCIRLNLQRGETLILTTDGVNATEAVPKIEAYEGTNLKEFASQIIEDTTENDDMSAIAICLYPRHGVRL